VHEPAGDRGDHADDHHADDHHADDHHSDDHGITDVNVYEWLAWTPLLLAIVVLGVAPNLLFHIIDPAVSAVAAAVKAIGA
jgi:NADH-quinone oxidoreductase subunit M